MWEVVLGILEGVVGAALVAGIVWLWRRVMERTIYRKAWEQMKAEQKEAQRLLEDRTVEQMTAERLSQLRYEGALEQREREVEHHDVGTKPMPPSPVDHRADDDDESARE